MGPRRIDNPGGGVFNPHSSLVPVNNQMVQFSVICLRINFYTHGKSLVRRYRGCTRGKMQIIQSAKCSKSRGKKSHYDLHLKVKAAISVFIIQV